MSDQPAQRENREGTGERNVVEAFVEYFARAAEAASGAGLTLAGGAALYWVAAGAALVAAWPVAIGAGVVGAVAGVGGLAMMGDAMRARR